ncbi:hypothetical protein D3C78_1923030 [compost metagenome]
MGQVARRVRVPDALREQGVPPERARVLQRGGAGLGRADMDDEAAAAKAGVTIPLQERRTFRF